MIKVSELQSRNVVAASVAIVLWLQAALGCFYLTWFITKVGNFYKVECTHHKIFLLFTFCWNCVCYIDWKRQMIDVEGWGAAEIYKDHSLWIVARELHVQKFRILWWNKLHEDLELCSMSNMHNYFNVVIVPELL